MNSERKGQLRTIGGWLKTLAFGDVDDVQRLGSEALSDAAAQRRARMGGAGASLPAPAPPAAPGPRAAAPPPRRAAPASEPLNAGCDPVAGDVQPSADEQALRRQLSRTILTKLGGRQ